MNKVVPADERRRRRRRPREGGKEAGVNETSEGGREGGREGSKCVARAPPIASAVVRSLVRSLSPSSRCHCCRARRRRARPATAVTLVFLWRCEIPEGRVRFVLLRPPRCQMKFHFICRGWHDSYTCTTTSSAPVGLSNRPLRGDLHFTAALQERGRGRGGG